MQRLYYWPVEKQPISEQIDTWFLTLHLRHEWRSLTARRIKKVADQCRPLGRQWRFNQRHKVRSAITSPPFGFLLPILGFQAGKSKCSQAVLSATNCCKNKAAVIAPAYPLEEALLKSATSLSNNFKYGWCKGKRHNVSCSRLAALHNCSDQASSLVKNGAISPTQSHPSGSS